MRAFLSKQPFLDYLEELMRDAVLDDRLQHNLSDVRLTTVRYMSSNLTINTTFSCLERTYRRVKRPAGNAKLRRGKSLLNAVEKFNDHKTA